MTNIKSIDRSAEKWVRVAGSAQTEYEEGVKNPKADWATQTAAAETAYEQGVQKAITRKAFGKGVKAAGTETWQNNAVTKGPSRYANGVSVSQDNYRSGFEPYHNVIANTKLPSRGAKGDPANIQRVAVLAKALHDKKLSLSGS